MSETAPTPLSLTCSSRLYRQLLSRLSHILSRPSCDSHTRIGQHMHASHSTDILQGYRSTVPAPSAAVHTWPPVMNTSLWFSPLVHQAREVMCPEWTFFSLQECAPVHREQSKEPAAPTNSAADNTNRPSRLMTDGDTVWNECASVTTRNVGCLDGQVSNVGDGTPVARSQTRTCPLRSPLRMALFGPVSSSRTGAAWPSRLLARRPRLRTSHTCTVVDH